MTIVISILSKLTDHFSHYQATLNVINATTGMSILYIIIYSVLFWHLHSHITPLNKGRCQGGAASMRLWESQLDIWHMYGVYSYLTYSIHRELSMDDSHFSSDSSKGSTHTNKHTFILPFSDKHKLKRDQDKNGRFDRCFRQCSASPPLEH